MSYEEKYLKYKKKYLSLKKRLQSGGAAPLDGADMSISPEGSLPGLDTMFMQPNIETTAPASVAPTATETAMPETLEITETAVEEAAPAETEMPETLEITETDVEAEAEAAEMTEGSEGMPETLEVTETEAAPEMEAQEGGGLMISDFSELNMNGGGYESDSSSVSSIDFE